MKRMLMVAGYAAIVAMTAFAGTNKVAGAAQGKEDAWTEARRERETQRKALETIQGELKRQREEHTTKAGREVHIDELLDIYADRTGKTILRDPAVPNTVIKFNLRDEQKFAKEEFPGVLEKVLEMNGVHLEPFGEKLVNAFPSRVAASKGVPLIMTPKRLEEKGRIVSMMVPFKNVSVKEASHALEAYKSVAGLFVVYERTNSIVVTDVDKNINRMLEIAKAIDAAQPVSEDVFVRQIMFAKAQDVMRSLASFVENPPNDAKSAHGESFSRDALYDERCMIRGKVLIRVDERSNKLIVVTEKRNMDFFDRLIEVLDADVEEMPVSRVLVMRYAKAQDVVRNLSAIVKEFQKDAKSANDRVPGCPTATRPFVGKVVILADERINGLIIVTSKINLPLLEHLVDDLDVELIDDAGKKTESTPVPQCPAKKEAEPKGASAPKP